MKLLPLFLLFVFAESSSVLERHRELWTSRLSRVENHLQQLPMTLQREQLTLAEKRLWFAKLHCPEYLSEFVEEVDLRSVPRSIATMDEQNCFERIRSVQFPFIWDLLGIQSRRHVCDYLAFSISKTVRKISTRVDSYATLFRLKQMYTEFLAEVETVLSDPQEMFEEYAAKWIQNPDSEFSRLVHSASSYEHFVGSTEKLVSIIIQFRVEGFSVVSNVGFSQNESRATEVISTAFEEIFASRKPPEYIMYVLSQICGPAVDVPKTRTSIEHLARRILQPYFQQTVQFANSLQNSEKAVLAIL